MSLSSTISKQIFVQGNSQAVTLEGLQDDITKAFQNGWMNIVMTLIDDEGNPVSGCTQVPMNYTAGSNGEYVGIFGDNNFYPAIGTGYTLLIDGNQSGSYLHVECTVEVKSRTS